MIIILGAGGFLGYSLASELNHLNRSFATVSRSFQWKSFMGEQRYCCPISSVDVYSPCILGDSTVIYMAGSTDLAYAEANETNDIQSHKDQMNLFFSGLQRCKGNPSRFIFFSSAGTVYGDAKGVKACEEHSLSPKSAYGRRNQALESFFCGHVHALNKKAHVFRVSNPFGPRQFLFRRKGLIQFLILSSLTDRVITLRANGLQLRDYMCSRQLSAAVIKSLASSDVPEFLNFSSGFSFTALDIVDILRKIGLSPKIQISSDLLAYEVQDSMVSSELLCQHLGLSPDSFYPFYEGCLEEMIEATRQSL